MLYFVLNLIVEQDAPLGEIVSIILLRVPFYIILALPVAVLLASSLALNRITRDRELIALKLAGVTLWRLLLPFVVFGGLLSVASFAAQEWLSPRATHQSDAIYRKLILEANVLPSLTPDTFFRSDNRVFYFHEAHRTGKHTLLLEQVLMYQLNGTNFPEIWTAREAVVEGDLWTLKGVVMHHLNQNGGASVDVVPTSGQIVLDLHKDMGFVMSGQTTPEEMTATQLAQRIREYRQMGVTGAPVAPLVYEYNQKFALPAACLICALIGIPLNIRYARLGGFVGLFLAVVVLFISYNCMVFAQSLSRSNEYPPALGAWLPDIIFALITLAFIWRER
jgi:LPS export ABC transporter permease LptG